jgi:hypothetical protein
MGHKGNTKEFLQLAAEVYFSQEEKEELARLIGLDQQGK